jgi:hypothetical protein
MPTTARRAAAAASGLASRTRLTSRRSPGLTNRLAPVGSTVEQLGQTFADEYAAVLWTVSPHPGHS